MERKNENFPSTESMKACSSASSPGREGYSRRCSRSFGRYPQTMSSHEFLSDFLVVFDPHLWNLHFFLRFANEQTIFSHFSDFLTFFSSEGEANAGIKGVIVGTSWNCFVRDKQISHFHLQDTTMPGRRTFLVGGGCTAFIKVSCVHSLRSRFLTISRKAESYKDHGRRTSTIYRNST